MKTPFLVALCLLLGVLTAEGRGIWRINLTTTAPTLQRFVAPVYPSRAASLQQGGVVRIWAVVEADGTVSYIIAKESPGPEFTEAVAKAVRKWSWTAGIHDGRPVPVEISFSELFDPVSQAVTTDLQHLAEKCCAPPLTEQNAKPTPQKKEIKDTAEYAAYMHAIQNLDPAEKAQWLEQFCQQYPNSTMEEDALELLMRTYQQLRNVSKADESAKRVLKVNPDNVNALGLLAYTKRVQASSARGQDLIEASEFGRKGLSALATYSKPDEISGADFDKLKIQLRGVFNAAIGISALNNKDYPGAQKALKIAVDATPTDFSLVYPLALADLEAQQPNFLDGIWYAARAFVLAPGQLKDRIGEYGRQKYINYHGDEDGWTDILTRAAEGSSEPSGFTVKPAPVR